MACIKNLLSSSKHKWGVCYMFLFNILKPITATHNKPKLTLQLKRNNGIIISVDVEIAFDKLQHISKIFPKKRKSLSAN